MIRENSQTMNFSTPMMSRISSVYQCIPFNKRSTASNSINSRAILPSEKHKTGIKRNR